MKLHAAVSLAALLTAAVLGQGRALALTSVLDSPHNLSASGGKGTHKIAFAEEKRVCVFCHAPHNANTTGPLWGRDLSTAAGYQPYDSSTLKAYPKPDKPTGSSRLCLSCHDGTIALGQFVGSQITTQMYMPYSANPKENPNFAPSELNKSHPISFGYTDALASQGGLAYPETLPPQIKLEGGSVLQCRSCHDPHNYDNKNFLVINNDAPGSPLCVACHKPTGWQASTHNPTVTATLAAACMNCHYAHSAPQPARLLQNVKEEDNCLLQCHNDSGDPLRNVAPLFQQSYRHPVDLATGVHDEMESLPAQTVHVECVDCHNPHQVNAAGIPLSSPPALNGPLTGVRIDNAGMTATKEYEICYKCHSGANATKFTGVVEKRLIQEADESKRFDGNNPSFHPVMAQRRGTGASLLAGLQASQIRVYCTDCHNSDQSTKAGGTGPNGPHGSSYPHILLKRYEMPLKALWTSSPGTYSASLYDLCFNCHSEPYIMGSSSGFVNAGVSEHSKHVKDRGIACYVCHDPHGVSMSSVPPATSQNNAHLINFNQDYTISSAVPSPIYQTPAAGGAKGSCTVACHSGGTHSYTP